MNTTLPTITLRSFGGAIREFQTVRVDPEGFVIRWGFEYQTLHLRENQLVRVYGNRINKRFRWRALNIEELRLLHAELTRKD